MRRTFWKQRMSNSRNNTNSAIFWLLAKKKKLQTQFFKLCWHAIFLQNIRFFANLWNFRNLLSGTIMLLLTQPLYHCRFHLSGRWFTKMTLSGLWIQRNREYFFMKKIFVRFYSGHEITIEIFVASLVLLAVGLTG